MSCTRATRRADRRSGAGRPQPSDRLLPRVDHLHLARRRVGDRRSAAPPAPSRCGRFCHSEPSRPPTAPGSVHVARWRVDLHPPAPLSRAGASAGAPAALGQVRYRVAPSRPFGAPKRQTVRACPPIKRAQPRHPPPFGQRCRGKFGRATPARLPDRQARPSATISSRVAWRSRSGPAAPRTGCDAQRAGGNIPPTHPIRRAPSEGGLPLCAGTSSSDSSVIVAGVTTAHVGGRRDFAPRLRASRVFDRSAMATRTLADQVSRWIREWTGTPPRIAGLMLAAFRQRDSSAADRPRVAKKSEKSPMREHSAPGFASRIARYCSIIGVGCRHLGP